MTKENDRLIKDATQREWVDLFGQVAKRAPYAANRLQAAVSAMYSDLYDRGSLDGRPRLPEGPYVFGDATLGRSSFSGFSTAWSMFRKESELLEDLRIHDLRRTFSTYAGEHVEASIPVIEAFLEHLSGTRSGIVSVYNRANDLSRTKLLAQGYGEFLDGLVRN